MSAAIERNGGILPTNWGVVLSGSMIFISVLGGGWTLFNSQLAYLEKENNGLRAEQLRREVEIKQQIKEINDMLLERRNEFF